MITINKVKENSPSWNANIRVGDSIYSVNDVKVSSPYDFLAEIARSKENNNLILLTEFSGATVSRIKFDSNVSLGVSFENENNSEKLKTKYKLGIDFWDIIGFSLIWIVICIVTLGIGLFFYVPYFIRFIVDNIESESEILNSSNKVNKRQNDTNPQYALMASDTYYDPKYPERDCTACNYVIPAGKVACPRCHNLQE